LAAVDFWMGVQKRQASYADLGLAQQVATACPEIETAEPFLTKDHGQSVSAKSLPAAQNTVNLQANLGKNPSGADFGPASRAHANALR
jgi:hypothetical protein